MSQLQVCPGGRYCFHYFYPQQVGEQILNFWRSLPPRQGKPSTTVLVATPASMSSMFTE
ncbi:MAG: hypothetical protein VKJ46_08710 [Leptolyngbyaceae bacterium]|nr:hypothetical protein [Leptolyngbyaceae bacterium]